MAGYLEGTLAVGSMMSVADHLGCCESCSRELKEFHELEEFISGMDYSEESDKFVDSCMDSSFCSGVMADVMKEEIPSSVVSMDEFRVRTREGKPFWPKAIVLAAACIAAFLAMPHFRGEMKIGQKTGSDTVVSSAIQGGGSSVSSIESQSSMQKNIQGVVVKFLGKDLEDRIVLDDFVAQFEDFNFTHSLKEDALVSR
jgi:hypothetical protein